MVFQPGACTTGKLRELLEDEEKLNHMIRSSEKFQGLWRATQRLLLSNRNLAKFNLSQKPTFRDAKLLLAMKYKEADRRRSILQAKQDRLAERQSVRYAQLCLQRMMQRAEEECERLFHRFVRGDMQLAEFLDSFLSSRRLHHIRLIKAKRLRELRRRGETGVREFHRDPRALAERIPEELHHPHHPRLPVCSLPTAVLLLPCCLPPLLPFGHRLLSFQCLSLHHSVPPCSDLPLISGPSSARPVRLEPLEVKQRKHHQQPQ